MSCNVHYSLLVLRFCHLGFWALSSYAAGLSRDGAVEPSRYFSPASSKSVLGLTSHHPRFDRLPHFRYHVITVYVHVLQEVWESMRGGCYLSMHNVAPRSSGKPLHVVRGGRKGGYLCVYQNMLKVFDRPDSRV